MLAAVSIVCTDCATTSREILESAVTFRGCLSGGSASLHDSMSSTMLAERGNESYHGLGGNMGAERIAKPQVLFRLR